MQLHNDIQTKVHKLLQLQVKRLLLQSLTFINEIRKRGTQQSIFRFSFRLGQKPVFIIKLYSGQTLDEFFPFQNQTNENQQSQIKESIETNK